MKWFDISQENKFYEKHFRTEALHNERLRELIIAASILLLAFGLLINVFILATDYKDEVPGLIDAFKWIILLFLFLAVRSLIVRKIIKKALRQERNLPHYLSYFNAFFEVSVPSAAIIILALHIEPVAALVSPIILLYFLFIILSSLELDPRLSFFTGLVAAAEYISISLYYLTDTEYQSHIPGLDLPLAFIGRGGILLLSGIIAGVVSIQIRKRVLKIYNLNEERNELEKVFGQQVSKEIVDDFINNNMKIENRTREACIMFLDIRNFSKYCEGKTPEEINEYQNSTLGFMIEIVNANHGIVNQILGDGFMATFGAPIQRENYCRDAVNASIEIISSLKKKNDVNEIPLTNIGIGLHAGEIITGNVGTEARKQYSVTGNAVILSARLEQLTKEFNTSVLLSKEVVVKSRIDEAGFNSLGEINAKGLSKPVEVFTFNLKNVLP
jgi:adenylate cyclase